VATITIQDKAPDEGESSLLEGVLYDLSGAILAKASIETFTLTLTDEDTGRILNSREDTDILDSGGGLVDANGNYDLTLSPADNAMVSTHKDEWHVAVLKWTWYDLQSNIQSGKQRIRFKVVRNSK
jgi:hypothetical protein